MRYLNSILSIAVWLMCMATAFAQNFTGPPELVAAAEKARTASFVFWTGVDYPRWSEPCAIEWTREGGGDEGGGGLNMTFGDGYVRFTEITITGTRQQAIENVIPHEVDHAVRASLVEHKITRWLDEGLAQLRESDAVQRTHASRRFNEQQSALIWQHMDAPVLPNNGPDVLAVYDCSWSVAKYLIETHGRQKVMELQKASPRIFANWHRVFGESPNVTRAKWRRWANGLGSRRLVMFGARWCSPCKLYENEIIRTGSPVVVVHESDANFTVLKQAYERSTGKELDQYPTFWIEGTADSRVVDYEPGLLQRLVGWFGNTVRGIIATVIGKPAPLRPRPDPIGSVKPVESFALADLPPMPTEELDPANITIVILAAMQDVGAVKGIGIKIAISKAEGPLMRAINEKIGSKATLILIPQRTKPDRFAAVTSAARITAIPAAVLVLVKSQSLGLKTLIAGKVERMLVGKIPDSVPVELIFERIHGEDFETITRAVLTRELQQFERSTPSATPAVTEDGIVAKLMPMLTKKIGEKLAASDNALVAKLGEKLTPETPPPDDGPKPTEQGMMGAMGLLVAERLRSMWIRRKAHKSIIETEASEQAV